MEKMYKVLPGKRITGRHQVYKAGDTFPASEACGDMDYAVKEKIVKVVEPKSAPKEEKKAEKKSDKGDDKDPDAMGNGPGKKDGGDK